MTDVCCLEASRSEVVYYTAIHDEHIQNKHMDTKLGKQVMGWIGRLGLTNIHY